MNNGPPGYVIHLTVRLDGGRHNGAMLFSSSENPHVSYSPIEIERRCFHGVVDRVDVVVERIVRPRQCHDADDLWRGGRLCLVSRHALAIAARPGAVSTGYPASQLTGRLSRPRNAQPPIRTGSDGSSRKPFNRLKMPGSATSATIAREAKAPAQ